MKKHNGLIGLWKFIFSVMIVLYHGQLFSKTGDTRIMQYGYIAVEFFFLVSGYLMAKNILNKKEKIKGIELAKETIQFIFKKIKAYFPYMLIFFIIELVLKGIIYDLSIREYVLSIWNLFYLRIMGVTKYVINGAAWYISAMLVIMLFTYPLIRKYRYNFIYLVSPITSILILGYLNQNYIHIGTPDMWLTYCYKGLIRAYAIMSLGFILYPLTEKIKRIKFNKFGSYLLLILANLMFIIPIITSQFIKKANEYDFVLIFIIAFGIMLAFSEKCAYQDKFNNKFIYYLEKLSLPIFLSHSGLRILVHKFSLFDGLNYYNKLGLYLGIVFVISIITMYIIEKLREKQFFISKIRPFFIKN